MLPPSSAASSKLSSSRYIAELHEFFASHRLPFGSPEDVVKLADCVSRPGTFEGEMASMVRSIIIREGGNIPVADLLEIVAVAIGGANMEERAPEFDEPIRRIVEFLAAVFRTRWGIRPDELPGEMPPVVTPPEKTDWATHVTPEMSVAIPRVASSSRIFAARAVAEGRSVDDMWPVLESQPEVVPEPVIDEAVEVSSPTETDVKPEPEGGLEPPMHEAAEVSPAAKPEVVADGAAEVSSATETDLKAEPEVGLEPLMHEAAEISPAAEPEVVAEPAVEAESPAHVTSEVASTPAPDGEVEPTVGLEPLVHQAPVVSLAVAEVEPAPKAVEAADVAETPVPNLRLPRFLQVAVVEQEEFEARPWIRRHVGWVVVILLVAAAIAGGAWAYERGFLQPGVRNDLTQPVVTPPAIVAPPEVKPAPSPDKAKSDRTQRRGSGGRGQQRIRPSGQGAHIQPAPIERVNPAGGSAAQGGPAPRN